MNKVFAFLIVAISISGVITIATTNKEPAPGSTSRRLTREECLVRGGVYFYSRDSGAICLRKDALL